MKNVVVLMIAAVLCLGTRGSDNEDCLARDEWMLLRDCVVEQRLELARLGVYAFVTNVAVSGETPCIHSQSWVDWLPDKAVSRRAYEQEKRDLGLDLLKQLEEFAQVSVEVGEVDLLKERATQLLAVAAWLKATPGYGNFILKRWAEDMALASLAGLAVNDCCPVENVKALLGKVDSCAECVRMQVAILNDESPDQWEVSGATSSSAIQQALVMRWGRHVREARRCLSGFRVNGRRLLFDDVRGADRRYAFYIPDVNPGDATIRRCWNLKDHEEVCVYGMYNHMRQDVEDILDCREKLGIIPMPTPEDLKDDVSRERFIDRLDILWAAKGRVLGLKPFGRLVVQIYRGRFIDAYTRVQRM